jgi:hypothetical protein
LGVGAAADEAGPSRTRGQSSHAIAG